MSVITSSEFNIKDDGDAIVKPLKCKIPQRCVQGRNKFYNKPKKVPNPTTTMYSKPDSQMQHSKMGNKNASRTQSDERRPQSATSDVRETSAPVQPVRPVRDFLLPATIGRPSTAARKGKNETVKTRPVIRVPLMKEPMRTRIGLLEEKKYENSELPRKARLQAYRTISSSVLSEENILSKLDQNLTHISWEEKKNLFEKLKAELKLRQRAMLELYNSLKKDKKLHLSPSEELLLVNTGNEHIPQAPYSPMCKVKIKHSKDKNLKVDTTPGLISLDLNKLYNIPFELVDACENTLIKQRRIIEWLDSYIKNDSKGIDRKEIVNRVKDMSTDGETLCNALSNVRDEFTAEIQDITTILRKGVDDMMVLQLRVEELTCKVSELNSKNEDLRKQLQKAEHFKSFNNKTKIEELERELKEEKCAKEILRNRYNRSDNQVKSGIERISQLEGMLEQARSQTRTLERTVQHLREENQNLQNEFDSELKKLTESITENSEHLNEIAVTREKLQLEKEELEKRLEELSQYYNESIENMKVEVNANINKVVESDKQYRLILEEKGELEKKIELLGVQLSEAERINKDLTKESSDKELKLQEFEKHNKELEDSKSKLQKAQEDIELYAIKMQEQHDILEQSQNKYMEILESVDTLKNTICLKEECIAELESKQSLLEQQLAESDQKMENYERQMAILKNKLSELQQDFGELSDMSKLRFVEEYEAKMLEMENRKDAIIAKLTEKENEQSNIIRLLQKNLELRTQVDEDLSNRISVKDSEIESITRKLESREKEIDKLEKMILALEDKRQKSLQQSKYDKQKINALENDLSNYQSLSTKSKRNSPEDINNIIEIFESELNLEPNLISGKYNDKLVSQKQGDRKKDKIKNFECHEISSQFCKMDNENAPAKSVKKICIGNDSYINDKGYRKKPLSNINTQKWLADISNNFYMNKPQPLTKPLNKPQNYQDGSLPVLISNHIRNERKYKMFKLAGHQL